MTKIAVIGGGASGIVAALAAKNENTDVTVYESCDRIGKKILATGNGRCNMTNINASIENYHGKNTKFMISTINRFWVNETLEMFLNMGILYKIEDGGKVYPYSDQASAVLDTLRFELDRKKINIEIKHELKEIINTNNGFLLIFYNGKKIYTDKVILAVGGKASPNLGSNGSGYDILKKLGHHITDLKPSLVQIKTENEIVKKLKGIKVQADVRLGNFLESGELLFTDYGLSGPPIFSLSSKLYNNTEISLDIMREYSIEQIKSIIHAKILNNPALSLENFFVGILNKRIGQVLLKQLGIAPLSRTAVTLSEKEIDTIVKTIKDWRFKIIGTMSWNNAQVTKGGVSVNEFNPKTMESKIIKGLYVTGELLDIDGDCGGYNLQWAWSSGVIAGRSCS